MATTAQLRPSTLSALHSPNFRLYFGGQLVSITGTWMQNLAQGYLVYELTRSEVWLGIVACAAGLPIVLLSPIAGVWVERVPRRTVLLVTQIVQMCLAFMLSALVFTDTVQVWHIVTLASVLGITNAFDLPARLTIVTEMVGREDMPSGIALHSIMNSASRVIGPTLAGIALVQVGPAWCFFLNGLSFFAVIGSLLMIQVPYTMQQVSKSAPMQQLREGLDFVRGNATIAPLLMLAATAGFFLLPVVPLIPAFAADVLHSPKEGYAALTAAQGIGSVIAGVSVSWLTYRIGRGRIIAFLVAFSAFAVIMLSRQVTIPLAALASGFTGLFLIAEMVNLNTAVQSTCPDEYRGRVLGLYTMAVMGLSPFGSLVLGALADAIGTPNALAIYGVMAGILGGLILYRFSDVFKQETGG